MKQVKTYEISLPLNEKDYNFLKKYIHSPNVEIVDEIREAFNVYESQLSITNGNILFDKNDYSKFIEKLKEKRFIEQFETGFGKFNINKFYSSLAKHLSKEKILFDKNYDTTKEQVKIIDLSLKRILKKYFNDDNPRWLIRTYIVGRAIYFEEKYR